MLKEIIKTFGELNTTIYDFECEGDTLPEHSHDKENTHITICARGEVEVLFPDKKIFLKAGNIIEFFPGQAHAIKALTDNSRIVNIPLNYDKQ